MMTQRENSQSTASRKRTRFGPREKHTHISREQVVEGLGSLTYASWLNLPLNTWITTNYLFSPLYGEGKARHGNTKACREAERCIFHRACEKFRIPFVMIRSLENPGGSGLHSHALLHGPMDPDTHALFRAWIEKRLQNRFQFNPNRPASAHTPIQIAQKQLLPRDAIGALRYLLKGADPAAYDLLQCEGPDGLIKPTLLKPQGTIYGPRLTITQPVRAEAQRRADLEPPESILRMLQAEADAKREREAKLVWPGASVEPMPRRSSRTTTKIAPGGSRILQGAEWGAWA